MEKTFEHRAEEQPTVEEKPLVDESPAAEESPAPAIEPVAEGVWLVRLPLPWPLAIVNVYLLEQQDGLLLIDCGVKTDESLGVLSQALAILGRTFQDIRQIVVTHMHADHVGAAAELRQRSGAPVLMERTEAKLIAPREPGEQFFVKAERYMREHGVPEELIGRLREMSRKASGVSERLVADGYLDDGDTLPYRGGALEAMVTPGHSPGLLSFLCREQRLLFSSDVILSGITPNIGVHPFYDDNPLDDYLRSLDRLHELDIGLVLPSHGDPFRGHREWITETRGHHDQRLRCVQAAAEGGGYTAFELVPRIWKQKLGLIDQRLAMAEALSHLHFLRHRGDLVSERRNGRVLWASEPRPSVPA